MLNNVSEQIRECYHHAENWAQKANAETDPKLKRDYLELERKWLLLAHSIEFNERLTDFSEEATRRTATRSMGVYYGLHIHRTDGRQQIEYNRHGRLPKLGEFIRVTLSGETIYVRVLNVITSPKERAELVHIVYAVEA